MNNLIAALRRAREGKVTVGRYSFTYRRPTDVEAVALFRSGTAFSEIAEKHVTGWALVDGGDVTENDILGDGGDARVPFDVVLWREWCADRPDFWEPVAKAVMDSYESHTKALGEAAKNS